MLTAAMPSMGAAGPRQGRAALLLAVTVGLARAVPATARDIPGTEEAHAGVVNFVHAFQDLSPSLELRELADVHAARVDVRAGIQAVAWGRLDGPPPTDVVNPRDYHDPFVRDPEDAKIGVLALAVGGPLPDAAPPRVAGLGLSLVWVPLPVPSRLARPDERWFPRPPHPRSGRRRRSPERARRRRRLGAVPRHRTGDRAGRGLRSALRLRGFAVDPATGEATLALASETLLRQALDRIHMTDVDAAVTVGDVALRAEATWFVDRPHPCASRSTRFAPAAIARLPTRCIVHQLVRRRTAEVPLAPPFVLRDAVQWGVGADTAVRGCVRAAAAEPDRLPRADAHADGGRPDTRLTATLRRSLVGQRVDVELRGVAMLEKGGWFAFPRVTWRPHDDVRLRLGHLVPGGPRTSLIGQFGRDDEVVLEARYAF